MSLGPNLHPESKTENIEWGLSRTGCWNDVKVKGKVIPITGPVWPRGWVEV